MRLQEQPIVVLDMLLMHAGDIVSREEICRRLWPDDTFVDFDNGLNNAISRLRAALGDKADQPRFIETVGRRGYRFIATVGPEPPAATPAASQPATTGFKTAWVARRRGGRRWDTGGRRCRG